MSVSKFFELDWRKNIIFLIIFVISTFLGLLFYTSPINYVGFPLSYHEEWIAPPPSEMIEYFKSRGIEIEVARSTFLILPFLLDILIYYIVACAFVFPFKRNEIKKKTVLDYLTLGIAAFLTIVMFLSYAPYSLLVLW